MIDKYIDQVKKKFRCDIFLGRTLSAALSAARFSFDRTFFVAFLTRLTGSNSIASAAAVLLFFFSFIASGTGVGIAYDMMR